MTAEVSEKVRRIVAGCLRIRAQDLPSDAAMGSTERWDSLMQLEILAATEQEFGVTIGPDEAVDLVSVSELTAFVAAHA